MKWDHQIRVETALEMMRETDPELHDICVFMIETNIEWDELVSLREPWTRKIYGGRLDVFGLIEGERSVQLTNKAWALLIGLAIPDWHHLGSIRSRWLTALAPFGLRIPFEEAVRWLALVRPREDAADDQVPF